MNYFNEGFLTKAFIPRALHHLTHLKALVEEPRKEPGKNDKKEVEKDEDEGRYSSSSTDGFRCI